MGALRKRLGHNQPFDIKYVEIDNEDYVAEATYNYR
jgi:alpha-L-arabinofuranosidase